VGLSYGYTEQHIIKPYEIEQSMSRIKFHKSRGPDSVPNN